MRKVKSIFCIREKFSGEFITYNNKAAWLSETAAKLAYSVQNYEGFKRMRFDDQHELEIVEIQ